MYPHIMTGQSLSGLPGQPARKGVGLQHPLKDYDCDCRSGFEEEILKEGVHRRASISDCPKGGCKPGTRQDLVNG